MADISEYTQEQMCQVHVTRVTFTNILQRIIMAGWYLHGIIEKMLGVSNGNLVS